MYAQLCSRSAGYDAVVADATGAHTRGPGPHTARPAPDLENGARGHVCQNLFKQVPIDDPKSRLLVPEGAG